MPPHRPFSILPLLLPLALAGCPTEPAERVKDGPPVEDEWSRFPASKEWLFATTDFSGNHKTECEHVLGVIKAEDACKGQLCEHGKDLANEWVKRCGSLVEEPVVSAAKKAATDLGARAGEAETDCSKKFEELARDGCSAATCFARGQRWATRCAKSEGSPLVMRMLQSIIDRRAEQGTEKTELDPRSCDELSREVFEAAKCKDKFACQAEIPRVENYQSRCEADGDRPGISLAVAEMIVLAAGGKPPPSIKTRAGSPGVAPGDVPVALNDGSGGVIFMCEERASDLARYVGSRKSCQGGKMVVACAFPTSNGAEVRVGALDFPDDATFSARYPTIVGAGEHELRDKEEAAALAADLDKAVAQARSTGGAAEAGRMVARSVLLHGLAVKRSAVVRGELTSRDGDLAPALKEIAKAKLAASRSFKVPPAESAGMIARARTRAFADLTADGVAQVGAPGRGFMLSTTSFLPRSMDVYLTVLRAARSPKLASRLATAEKARGIQGAEACGGWEKKLQEIKKALVSCNFGISSCDDAKVAALVKQVDEARLASEAAFHEMESARTADADDADAIQRAADGAGCREPWW